MFRCEFSTTNAAFDDAPASEAARILREFARKIENGEAFDGPILDVNGNRIGAWSISDPDAAEG